MEKRFLTLAVNEDHRFRYSAERVRRALLIFLGFLQDRSVNIPLTFCRRLHK
jgi:hypothetical protein